MPGSALHDAIWERVPEGAVPEDFERRRSFLAEHAGAGERVLDLGCGAGDFSRELERLGAVPVAVDVSAIALARASRSQPGLDARLATPGEPLPLADHEVAGAWVGEVIEHVADPGGLVRELARVLAPGGWLALTAPATTRWSLLAAAIGRGGPEHLLDVRADHLRFFTARSLRDLLSDEFADVEVQSRGTPRRARLFARARAPRSERG